MFTEHSRRDTPPSGHPDRRTVRRRIAGAKIVTPEQAAVSSGELAMMQISIRMAAMAETPLHIVQFEDGVAAMVTGDPRDRTAWRKALAAVYSSALAGTVGPVAFESEVT